MVDIPRMEYDDIDFGSSSYNKLFWRFGQSVHGLKWNPELDKILGLRAASVSQRLVAILGINKIYTLEQVKWLFEDIQESKIQVIIPSTINDGDVLSNEFEKMVANSKQYYDVTQWLKDLLQFQELQDHVLKRKSTTILHDFLFQQKMKSVFSRHSSIWSDVNNLYTLYPLAKSDIHSLILTVLERDDINISEKKNIIKNMVTSWVSTIYMLTYEYPEYYNNILDTAQEFYRMTPIEHMSITAVENIVQELINKREHQKSNSMDSQRE